MKTKFIFLSVAFLLGMALPSHAQSSAIYLMPSAQFLSLPNLNRELASAGFPDTPGTFGSGAGGFGTINDRWRIGGEGTYFSGTRNQDNTSVTSEGGLGVFYAGYLVGHGAWHLVPQAGLGFGGVAVNATRSTAGSLTDLLRGDGNTARVATGGLFLHTGISLERDLADGLTLGLKASYNLAFSEEKWTAPGTGSSVSDRFCGVTLNFVVGFRLR